LADQPDDICPRSTKIPATPTRPHSPPLFLSSVYECDSPAQADAMLGGRESGYVYSRDGHPNADMLAEKCRELHGAERAAITGSGMGALAAAMLAMLKTGDHIVVSKLLYGRSMTLLVAEAARLGIESTLVDTCDLAATRAAMQSNTRLVVVETITNPLLRVSDIDDLAAISHGAGAKLLVDNTLAGAVICRPLALGADFVLESITKTMNGHSDLVLGLLCGRADAWERVPAVLSTYGLSSAPFDCWLALRGLATLAVRIERACASALEVARFLQRAKGIAAVYYPALDSHPDCSLARQQFGDCFGTLVTFTLAGGIEAATRFIKTSGIPFCPSLGELNTTLSHPQSTSHRGLSEAERGALGIFGGTIRLSVGIESLANIEARLTRGLGN
jgi:cystathionine beta-lyase/cystathionine gamma-synthase